mgnify:CR=1 FL=1
MLNKTRALWGIFDASTGNVACADIEISAPRRRHRKPGRSLGAPSFG